MRLNRGRPGARPFWVSFWASIVVLASFVPVFAAPQSSVQESGPVKKLDSRAALVERQRVYREEMDKVVLRTMGAQAVEVEAVHHFMELERQLAGENTPGMAFALRKLAEIAVWYRNDPEALRLLNQAVDVERKIHGDGHWHVTDTQQEIAFVQAIATLDPGTRRKLPGIDPLPSLEGLRHALPILRRSVGEQTAKFALALEQLAWALRASGNPFAAAVWAERALVAHERVEGRRHPGYVRTLQLQALLHHELEENDLAQRMLAEAETAARQVPDLDPGEASKLAELRGSVQTAVGDLEGAARAYETAARLAEPSGHNETANHVRILALQADVAQRRRDFDVARRLWDRVLAYRKQNLNRDNGEYVLALTEAGLALHDQGDLAGAIKLAREARAAGPRYSVAVTGHYGARVLQNLRAIEKGEHESRRAEIERLAVRSEQLRRQGKLDEAIRELESQIALYRAVTSGAESDLVIHPLERLASAQLQSGRFATAREARKQRMMVLQMLLGDGHWQTTDARLALGQIDRIERLAPEKRATLAEVAELRQSAFASVSMGLFTGASSDFRLARDIQVGLLGENDPGALDIMADLATSLWLEGRYAEAETVATQTVILNERVRGPSHPSTTLSVVRVAAARESRGDLGGAKKLLLQAGLTKRPAPGNGRQMVVRFRYHANGQLATAAAGDQAELGFVPAPGDRHEIDRDIVAIRALAEIERRILGETHPARHESLEWIAKRHLARHQFDGAIAARRDIVGLRAKQAGPDHWRTVDARADLAGVERMATVARTDPELLEAAEHADRQVRLDEAQSGHAASGGSDNFQRGVRALILWRRVLGERAFRCIRDLEIIGAALREQGQLDAAERVLTRVTELRRATVGEGHPAFTEALCELGKVLLDHGRPAEAEPMLRRAAAQFQSQIGKTNPATAVTLLDWGRALHAVGDLEHARTLCQESVAVLRAQLGEKHRACLMAMVELAAVLRDKGDYPRALSLLEAVRKHLEPSGFPQAADTLSDTCATYLAGLLGKMGDLARAKLLLESLVEQRRAASSPAMRVMRPGHFGQDIGQGRYQPSYAERVQYLAELMMELGDSSRACRLYDEALDLTEELLGPDHPAMAERRVGLARALVSRGDLARAEDLLTQAERNPPRHGDRDPLLPMLFTTRARARAAANKPEEAIALLERALAASVKIIPDVHPEHVRRVNDLAEAHMARGDFAAAQPLLERGLFLNKSRAWSDGVTEGTLLVNLARCRASLGDPAGARELYRKALASREAHIARNLHGLGERERLTLVEKVREPFLESLDLLAGDPALDRETYGRLIVWKGIATAAARQEGHSKARRQRVFLTAGNPRLNPLGSSDPLRFMRELLSRVCFERFALSAAQASAAIDRTNPLADLKKGVLENAQAYDTGANRLASLIEDIGAAEAQDVAREGELSRSATALDVASAIPAQAVLLDFIRYTPRGGVPRYAVFVLRRQDPLRRFDLGPAEPIDHAVLAWREAIESDSDDSELALELSRRLWAPVSELCRDVATIMVAPDGEVNHLPWAALPDLAPGAPAGAFLLERHTFVQVASARRLVEAAKPAAGHLGLLVVGGVDYDRRRKAPASKGTLDVQQLLSGHATPVGPALLHAPALLGTGKEVEEIQAMFEATHDPSAVSIALSGVQADQPSVKQAMTGMRYIHVATHGFFAPPEIRDALDFEDRRPAFRKRDELSRKEATTLYPGLLSGLMLAGVNDPPEGSSGRLDWSAGLLTADEVAGMDLVGCELAVLSACETAVGRVTGGEGVLGLQRAFHVAGARFVIASLWRVGDQATRTLMSQFYENLWVRKLSVPEAMRQAQLSAMRGDCQPGDARGPGRLARSEARAGKQSTARRQHPRTWAAWVVSGVPEPTTSSSVIAKSPAQAFEPSRALRRGTCPQERPGRGAATGSGRAAEPGHPHSTPPGWRGGKIEPFLAVAVDPQEGAAFTTTASGRLQHYTYPDFVLKGSYKLAGPAYQVVLAGRRGLLFALVTEPKALKLGRPFDPPSGPGKLHVYDIKSILDKPNVTGTTLAPIAVLPQEVSLPQMLRSKDGTGIYCLERDTSRRGPVRLFRVDTATNKVAGKLDLPVGTETMCLTPDGSTLYAAVSTKGHTGDLSAIQEGQIVEVDSASLKVRRTAAIAHDPYDIQANDAGLVFVSGGSGQHTQVAVVNMNDRQSIVARWPGVYMGARIRLSPDQKRLFIAGTGSPHQIEAWRLPANPSGEHVVEERVNETTEIPLGGEIFLTPRGDFLLTRTGGIVPINVADGG